MRNDLVDYQKLVKRLKENDEIARKFFEIQTSVLATLNFEDFFSKLLGTITEKFGVPYVWLSLIYPSKVTTLVHRLSNQKSINRISRKALISIVGNGTKPILMNKYLDRFYCLAPEENVFDFKSIAITPIILNGELIGSFNQADHSASRFHPDLDPSFLAQLGLIISICFSNVLAHEELQILAYKDPLTGLLNRRALESVLKLELARAKRYSTSLSIVFIDIDDFKLINDRFGHDHGDEMLIHMASTFTELSRESDIIARFAGDEFVLILPGSPPSEATVFMERITNYFKTQPLLTERTEIPVRFSYGISSADEVNDAADFLKKADGELYKAKKRKSR